jgi:hypothetical protein
MLVPQNARITCNTVPTLMFKVQWDEDRFEYVALDTAGTLLMASPDIDTAIGSARRVASAASRSGVRVFVMVRGHDGSLSHDSTAEPTD